MSYFEENIEYLNGLCDEGLKGKFKLPVREVSLPLTNKCNNYCIMCHMCDKDYENHTYHNEEPYCVDIESYKKIIHLPQKTFIEKIRDFLASTDVKNRGGTDAGIDFVFGTAESLLNPDIYEICKYTKSIYPNCKIRLISNGTIPPKKDIVKYIDRIGFSIDGCTKETFEMLRPPAKFEHVMDVIAKWDEAADKYNPQFSFGFATVVVPNLLVCPQAALMYCHETAQVGVISS